MNKFTTEEYNVLALRCYELNRVANKIQEILEERFSSIAGSASVYTFKNRIKPPESILSKVRRKRWEGERSTNSEMLSYSPDHVTDVWGCRFVTLYQMQIPLVVKNLLSDLDQFNLIAKNKINLVEFIIYTNRPLNDPLSIVSETQNILDIYKISAGINSPNIIKPPENRKSAYSSVHLIFSMDIEFIHAGKKLQVEKVKFETQIRDIFEEGWGEIQHQLLYSEKDKFDLVQVNDDELDPFWQPHLNALKTFVDGCSQHASIIKKSYDFVRLRRMPPLDSKSATYRPTDRDGIIQILKDNGSTAYIIEIETAYRLIIQAESAENRDESRAYYTNAAIVLEKLIAKMGEFLTKAIPGRFDRSIGYFIRIECANSLYLSGEISKLDTAISIYRELMIEFPEDPLVKLRLSLAMQSDERDNIEELNAGRELVVQALGLISSDPLTGANHWISISCYIHIGFINWCLSKLEKSDPIKQLNYLEEAMKQSVKGYRYWNELESSVKFSEIYRFFAHKALSNLLYYGAKLIMGDDQSNVIVKNSLEEFIDIYERIEVPEYWEAYRSRDNLMHAKMAVGRVADARHLAKQNVTELKRRAEVRAGKPIRSLDVERFLAEEERPSYRAAANVLADPEGAL